MYDDINLYKDIIHGMLFSLRAKFNLKDKEIIKMVSYYGNIKEEVVKYVVDELNHRFDTQWLKEHKHVR